MAIEIGERFVISKTVTKEMTAAKVGSGDLEVLATPVMIALFEECSAACLKPFLEPGKTSVGISVEANHIAATPVGAEITVAAEIIETDGKIITFRGTASDIGGEIGSCIHKRAIINAERFLEKTYAKLAEAL